MNQEQFYHYLNLPAPPFTPDEVITDAVLFGKKIPENVKLTIPQLDGSYQNVTIYNRIQVREFAANWILETVPELQGHAQDIGIQTHRNSNKTNGLLAQFPIHTDGKRRGRYVLCYLYDLGGPGPETVWWHEKGCPIIRELGIYNETNGAPRDKLLESPETYYKLNNQYLKELERTTFKQGAWNLLRADVLHSVHGVEHTRVGFAIGFSNEEVYDKLVDKYGIL